MGLVDQLVAMSNWDADRPPVIGKPRVGDYRNVDWERLSHIRPAVLIIQVDPSKMPPGLAERARDQNIRVINVRVNRLQDVFLTFAQLGRQLNAAAQADRTAQSLRTSLEDVRRRAALEPPVRTYLARDSTGMASVGGDNFLDDLLSVAGGKNVLTGGENAFPSIDVERLTALDPDAIIHLLPSASPQVAEQADKMWRAMPDLKAVRTGRVYILTDYFLLQPGARVADTARLLAESLHPQLLHDDHPATRVVP